MNKSEQNLQLFMKISKMSQLFKQIFFEKFAFIWPFFIFENLTTANGQIWPFYFFGPGNSFWNYMYINFFSLRMSTSPETKMTKTEDAISTAGSSSSSSADSSEISKSELGSTGNFFRLWTVWYELQRKRKCLFIAIV